MIYNKIVDIVHVCFLHILLPQFLTDGLVNIIIFEVGRVYFRFGTLDARVRDGFWHLWIGEGSRCLGHDGLLTGITVGFPKVMLQILHFPDELV